MLEGIGGSRNPSLRFQMLLQILQSKQRWPRSPSPPSKATKMVNPGSERTVGVDHHELAHLTPPHPLFEITPKAVMGGVAQALFNTCPPIRVNF